MTQSQPVDPAADADRLADLALAEDGIRDLTTEVTVPGDMQATARVEFRATGIVAGIPYADSVIRACGLKPMEWRAAEGQRLFASAVIGVLSGHLAAILRAERPLLNMLQRASGIASATREYVTRIDGTRAKILHTRKTAPGLRLFDVRAVLAGGGHAHRLDLAHEVMVKDNHWRALENGGGSLTKALAESRKLGATRLHVEIESADQLRLACEAGATRLLIDNQSPEVVQAWVGVARRLSPGIELEASGGITLSNVRAYAEAGADYLSIGALTHSVKAADVSLEVDGR